MASKFRSLFWEAIHQLVVHPLLFFTRDAQWVRNFHDYSREKAWPKQIEYEEGYTALLKQAKRSERPKK